MTNWTLQAIGFHRRGWSIKSWRSTRHFAICYKKLAFSSNHDHDTFGFITDEFGSSKHKRLLPVDRTTTNCLAPMSADEPESKKAKTMPEKPRTIALFDVDGTLTIPRGEITDDMMSFMKQLSEKITVGIVGGSDLPKQEEQLGSGVVDKFPYNFSQNGLVAYKDGKLLEVQTISKHLGEDNVKRIVNWVLAYLAKVDIPVKVRQRS